MLRQLLRRSGSTSIYSCRDDVVDVLCSIAAMRLTVDSRDLRTTQALAVPFVRLLYRDVSIVQGLLHQQPLTSDDAHQGRMASFLALCLSKVDCGEELWAAVVEIFAAGLECGCWDAAEVRAVVQHVVFWGVISRRFLMSVEQYVERRAPQMTSAEVGTLAGIVAQLPELRGSSAFQTLATSAAKLVGNMSAGAVGSTCAALLQASVLNVHLLTAIAEQGARLAEECDGSAAIHIFTFAVAHNLSQVDLDGPRCIIEAVLVWHDSFAMDQLSMLAAGLARAPTATRALLQLEYAQLTSFLARSFVSLLAGAEAAAVPLNSVQAFLTPFAHLSARDLRVDPAVMAAFARVASWVEPQVEALVSNEAAVFALLPTLLSHGTEEMRRVGQLLVCEIAAQGVQLTAVQTFRLMLDVSEHRLFHRRVLRHLRHQFSLSVEGIPMIQLCTTLMVMREGRAVLASATAGEVTVEEEVDREEDENDLQHFLMYCSEVIAKELAPGLVDVRCTLAFLAHFALFGFGDAVFTDKLLTYLNSKVAFATPSLYEAETARTCQEHHVAALETFPSVQLFLRDVVSTGSTLELGSPREWLERNDPANAAAPLTEEQKAGWQLLQRMNHTPSCDTEALAVLCGEYMGLIDKQRVDDLQYFFSMFAEKVYKNDALIKEALGRLMASGAVEKLSGQTITSILVSLTQIRFGFYQHLKKFLLAVSTEQWSQMDAATIAALVQSFGKLSLRLPTVLRVIAERLVLVYKLLQPIDTAVLLAGLQALGFADTHVIDLLMQHAANNAKRFDEVSLAVLWSAPHVHRLLVADDTSVPLLNQSCIVRTAPHLRHKLIAEVKRSALSRESIEFSVLRLSANLDAPLLEAGSQGSLEG